MPRGDNPNSKKNLVQNKGLTPKERRKNASKAGKASAAKRKEYASFRECFKEHMDDDTRKALFDMLLKRAKQGNLKAFEILRDTLGENPNKMEPEKEKMESDGFEEMMKSAKCNIVDDSALLGGGQND